MSEFSFLLGMIHLYLRRRWSVHIKGFVTTSICNSFITYSKRGWIVLVRAFVICIYSSGGLDMTDLMFIPRHSFVICLMRERIIHVTPFVVFYCLICIQRRDGLHI